VPSEIAGVAMSVRLEVGQHECRKQDAAHVQTRPLGKPVARSVVKQLLDGPNGLDVGFK
jgi:hypothetical protein